MDTTRIARVAYDARRAYMLTQGYNTHPEWFKLDAWQRQLAVDQVKTIVINPGIAAEALHEVCCHDRREHGWTYGPRVDLAMKRDPMVLGWLNLTRDQHQAEHLVVAVVRVLQSSASV